MRQAGGVRVVPTYEHGKARVWYVCVMTAEEWARCDSDPCQVAQRAENEGKSRRSTSPELVALIRATALAWSTVPHEAADMGARLHAFVMRQSARSSRSL